MKTTTKSIPIYYGSLTIIITKDFKAVLDKYKLQFDTDINDYGAFAWAKGHKYFICVPPDIENHLIAHEVVHLVNYIFLHTHVELDRRNDEPQAYLTGWIFKQIEDFLKKSLENKKNNYLCTQYKKEKIMSLFTMTIKANTIVGDRTPTRKAFVSFG